MRLIHASDLQIGKMFGFLDPEIAALLQDARQAVVGTLGQLAIEHGATDTGAIIVVMQRVHMDDLTGFLLDHSDEWEVLGLPAIAEGDELIQLSTARTHHREAGEVLSIEREPLRVLEPMRQQIGGDAFSAQYQQAPVPPGGAMIKRHWIKRYSALPDPGSVSRVLQSWDTASKGAPDNDWSVCTTWMRTTDNQFYLADLWRGRVDYPTLKEKARQLAERWRPSRILIEDAGTAIGLIAELKREVCGVIAVEPDRDKVSRMSLASAKIEAGQLFLPEHASWLPELEAELFAFPAARYDDQCDSISQALNDEADSLWVWHKLADRLGIPPD